MKILRAGEKAFEGYLTKLHQRRAEENLRVERAVRSILNGVRERGDQALIDYTLLYDHIKIPLSSLRVSRAEIKGAYQKVSPAFLRTLKRAARRIRGFHQLTIPKSLSTFRKGIRIGRQIRPIERVGLYVPGGKASYPSTVLMAAIPAKVAGVSRIIMTTPQQPEGISPAVLVAADLAGVDEIYRVGGAHAIAALAFGTESIPKVDKIVGPGNRYVAAAKRLVFGVVDVDMIAGPSEILVIADGKSSPASVAADLISQAEHDEMALPILITTSPVFARRVTEEIERQLASLSRREIATASLEKRGAVLIVRDLGEAIDLANRIAPEHLELSVARPFSLLKKVSHAGAVFLGPYTPEAIGDYMAGPSHVLPTAGTARFSSALGVEEFIKRLNWISFTKKALEVFEADVKRFAQWEGLEGHYRALEVRLKARRDREG